MSFPFDGANVFVGGAVAIVAVLRADAVAVLCYFARDPVCPRESADDVAHQLRLADAAGVAANYDHTPLWSCAHLTSLPAWLLIL
jgi:hypothetical protein